MRKFLKPNYGVVGFLVKIYHLPIKEKEKDFNGKHDPKWLDNFKHGTLKDILPGDLIRVDFVLEPRPTLKSEPPFNTKDHFLKERRDLNKKFPRLNPADYRGKKNKAVRIWNYHPGAGDRKVHGQITFWGEVTAMAPDKKTIEVHMPKPEPENVSGYGFHGYQFWKEAGRTASLSKDVRPNEYRTVERLAAARRYMEGADKERIRTFYIDDAVRILRNGKVEQSYKDLQVGDKVSVFYLPFYETQYINTIPIYPEVILSSSKIEPTGEKK